jgi:hypothetical protein
MFLKQRICIVNWSHILARYVPNGCSPGKKWSLAMQQGTRLARNGHWEHNEKKTGSWGMGLDEDLHLP